MQMKWKKTGAALLVAGMTLTGAGYAWANENLFDTVDLSKLNSKNPEETKGNSVNAVVTIPENTVKPTTAEAAVKESDLPEIPEGYTAGNLEALYKAYENAGSPTAKAAIKRNIESAIAKYEASIKEVENTTEQQVDAEDTTKKEEKAAVKEERKELHEKQKEERKALQAKQKEERKALKEDNDDDDDDYDDDNDNDEQKEAVENHKEIKEKQKEERKALKEEQKAEKHENKKNKNDDDNEDDEDDNENED
ncbi:hypothetical protein [Psychrobacillus vulpis]|uniref:Uncharacterized protein n=1 Tax=Psychrobacillus vulpis TaxID=2325572 RepID=A0A544TUU8_9BACI|nr:hypothetical protein [Psychrobacillus vulpis]TQR21207.1 hypothetical protein FG384_03095 [Psychrobacillus vulpis]